MKSYRYVADSAVVEFLGSAPRREQALLILAFRSIAAFPSAGVESGCTDEIGHPLFSKRVGAWEITWWLDDPVHLVHIFACERLR